MIETNIKEEITLVFDSRGELEEFINTHPELCIQNPEYKKKKEMGLWLGNTEEYIRFYKGEKKRFLRSKRDALIIPYGLLDSDFLKEEKKEHFEKVGKWEEIYSPIENEIKLYPYQEKALNALLAEKMGILSAPCGSGKTQIGLALACALGGRTLWLTHTKDLLVQSLERAKSLIKHKDGDFSIITEGKAVPSAKIITFATVQTLAKKFHLYPFTSFNTIICDECHHAICSEDGFKLFSSVLNYFYAPHKYGLTATPERPDGLTPCMHALLGKTVYEIKREEVKNTTVPLEYKQINTDFLLEELPMRNDKLDYTKLISIVCEDFERSALIVDELAKIKGTTLVLSERVSHLKTLSRALNAIYGESSVVLLSADKKSVREQKLQDLREGKIRVLFASFQLAKEGLDIPSLQNLVFASPIKTKNLIIQAAGRACRKTQGKEKAVLYDFVDTKVGILKTFAKKRLATLQKEGLVS